ncbi:hypothetical protein NDU88_006434, partial [Pleurodeles waltl]
INIVVLAPYLCEVDVILEWYLCLLKKPKIRFSSVGMQGPSFTEGMSAALEDSPSNSSKDLRKKTCSSFINM